MVREEQPNGGKNNVTYKLSVTDDAKKDILKHLASGNKVIFDKIQNLLEILVENPMEGKYKFLKYMKVYSRRLSKEHRLLYKIIEYDKTVVIVQAYGHNDD